MNISDMIKGARDASKSLLDVNDAQVQEVLKTLACELVEASDAVLEANEADLELMSSSDPKYDRLRLTPARIHEMARDIRNVAMLPSPLGEVREKVLLANGLQITKVSVPFGVVGVIFESRPNVSVDVATLCLKSGNACLLKGGHEAQCTNEALVAIIRRVLSGYGFDPRVVTLLPADREATRLLLEARGKVDVIIPRGGSRLIEYVRNNSRVPVIETGAGVCHTYVHSSGRLDYAEAIVTNAKTRRVSVCNALDCLLIDRDRVADLPRICGGLISHNVRIYADAPALDALKGCYPSHLLYAAGADSYGTEYLDYAMSVKCVDGVDEAIAHIDRFGSGHSECIVAQDAGAIAAFERRVDAACVYVNAPTSFTDGAQFGLGAEIGISTQKLHARGPMALRELTSYKWLVRGEGQTRP